MIRFEQFSSSNPELYPLFLELVYHIFCDPSYSKTDLEVPFLLGLRCKDIALRNRFFQIFNQSIEHSLLARMTHIFSVQNWEPLAHSFWIKQALELFLALVIVDVPLQVVTATSEHYANKMDTSGTEGGNDYVRAIKTDFLSEMRKTTVFLTLDSLKELFQQDIELTHNLWILIFPALWSLLSKENQSAITKSFKPFLSKEYHLKQHRIYFGLPHIIQTLIEGISHCDPVPFLPTELLKYLAKNSNSWHACLYLLEHPHRHLEPEYDKAANDLALYELYNQLSEHDLSYYFLKSLASDEETKYALLLEQHDRFQKSQEVTKQKNYFWSCTHKKNF